MGESEGDMWNMALGFNNMEESNILVVEYFELVELLSEACPNIEISDTIMWPYGPYNSYSIKSCYDKLLQASGMVEMESAPKTVLALMWHTKIPMKVKIFGWRMFLDRLTTHTNLVVRGVITNIHDKVCVFGFSSDEDINHVFIYGPKN